MSYLMVVDDDADFANAAAEVLRHAGHEVEVQTDIDQALARMEQRQPDLVVLDVMFPHDDAAGFALARRMHRGSSKLKDVPIILLTAINSRFPLGFSVNDIHSYWLPVSDFLEKPVELDMLVERVNSLLNGPAGGAPHPSPAVGEGHEQPT